MRATQFRQWATQVLREFAIKGYVLDKKRMENGAFLGEDYFERLLEKIREIRLSERHFYQKITDVVVAKNYLTRDEMESLGRIVNTYLDLAEDRARRKIPMTMEDWAKRLNAFLEFSDRQILQGKGKINAKIARAHAESEFKKYRIVQDRLFESDFDKMVKQLDIGYAEGDET